VASGTRRTLMRSRSRIVCHLGCYICMHVYRVRGVWCGSGAEEEDIREIARTACRAAEDGGEADMSSRAAGAA
jgi:hypothetical protein